MSYELMRTMILESQTTGSTKTVAVAVASYPPPGGDLAFPSNKTLIDEWGLTERTIQRGLRVLERLGELQRQPQLETPQRPRVYRVDPSFRRQLAFPEARVEGGRQTEVDARLTPVTPPATSRAPVEGWEEGLKDTPPYPPASGGDRTDLLVAGSLTPRVTARAERAAARRRRRRRRRDDDGASFASGVDCPLPVMTASAADELLALEEAWTDLAVGLRDAIGETHLEVWFAGAHIHRSEPELLELGVNSSAAGWVPSRFGPVVERLAGRRVLYVACHAAMRSEEGARR